MHNFRILLYSLKGYFIKNMSEKIPSVEFSEEEEEIIASLREQNGTARSLLIDWMEKHEDPIECNLSIARLMIAAGLLDGARENLELAHYQAGQENNSDRLAETERLLNELDNME